ncbi:MAG: exodeoxyribonuclease V subunit gamma [Solirubrobacterales bacterium]
MLHLHVAERADALVAALPGVLSGPGDDIFEPAVLSVPSRGVERWLTQTLSHHLGATDVGEAGVAANIEFPFPETLVAEAVSDATGFDPRSDPWISARLVWPLLEVVDANADAEWLSLLAAHIGAGDPAGSPRRSRRAAVVSHIAHLFSRYATYRPDMIRAWAAGEDVDGAGVPLSTPAAWQSHLWRRLRERVGAPSPPERLAEACERLRAEPDLAHLPQNISVFGLTRLPASHLEVLDALATHRDVHLFLLHPSPQLWEELATDEHPRPETLRRADDHTLDAARNPLLASWGHDARELQVVLTGDRTDVTTTHHAVPHDTDSLLHRLQSQVAANEPPPGPPPAGEPDTRPALADDDRSVQVHSCHGRERQVEVLRDAIMHLLADDPTLEPRDVIVMCPNVEDFAPLIHAVFGAGRLAAEEDELAPSPSTPARPDLRVRLADRSLRRTNPILGTLAELLDLASARFTASELLDFANLDPVRLRFGFDDDDLSRILEWINAAHIHWGIDEAHRKPFNVPVAEGTWRRGLDRILLGVAMSEDDARIFEYVLPLDDVESGAISLAGRFAELIDRIDAAFASFAEAKPLGEWAEALTAAADNLTGTPFGQEWERLELDRLLEDLAAEAETANEWHDGDGSRPFPATRASSGEPGTGTADAPALTLAEVRSLLTPRLAGRPTSANFRTGHISVCTLTPMRSVPHRVVCLLGLDQEAFPRRTPRDGDDLLLDDPHLADRDPRTEDRQLLLDALMAAADNLVITYTGNDERTNLEVPPAVPVGELLDVVDATVSHPDPGGAKDRILTRHPLQPFDRRNFDPARGPVKPKPWGFDRVNLAGAQALEGERSEPAPFLDGPLEPMQLEILELDSLVKFVEHPVRAFLKQRLGIEVRDFFQEVDDDLPIELDGLGRWQLGDSYLASRRRGVPEREACLAEIRRGTLPPEQLGKSIVDQQIPRAEELIALAERVLPKGPRGERDSCDVRVPLSGGILLTGTIGGIEEGILGDVTLSKLKAKHRLGAWVRLLALTAARPETPWEAVTVGMHPTIRGGRGVSRFGGLGADEAERSTRALACLEVLVDLFRRGMREPLPLFCESSAAYAAALRDGKDTSDAIRNAAAKFDNQWSFDGEIEDAEHRFVFGDIGSLDDILAIDPLPDEGGAGWFSTETTFGLLARRLWNDPLELGEVERG